MEKMDKKEFNQMLEDLAEKNWKVKKLLKDFNGYENLPQNIKDLIDKELNITSKVEIIHYK